MKIDVSESGLEAALRCILPFVRPRTGAPPVMLNFWNRVRLTRCFGVGMVLLAAFLFLSAAIASAQTRVLTLEEALAIAAEKNRDIEKARAYIAWAQGKYVEERAAAFPQLMASASLGWDKDESQKIYSPMQTQRTERRSALIGLTQPLFTWGQVSAAIRAAKVGLLSAEEQLRVYQQELSRTARNIRRWPFLECWDPAELSFF